MVSLEVDRDDPVTRFATLLLVVGTGLLGLGLYRTTTYSCGPARAGCGDSFGFAFVLWGVPLVALSTVVLAGRIASQNLRDE
ncbi:hypothetical protein [Halorussus salinisoli]|uniref:hypothetical protein n=1 Tax=Halorussus salinisoli TaxID=2558242 RepID=UPI0010C17A31|nr:hypothetical protein [Halorussus salinisoli]